MKVLDCFELRLLDDSRCCQGYVILSNFRQVPLLKFGGKKGSIAGIEYQLLVTATNNFDEANILGEGGLRRVHKAHFNDQFHAAVKKYMLVGRKLKENSRMRLSH